MNRMVLKVLTLNLGARPLDKDIPDNIEITHASFKDSLTLHDFDVLILDTSEALNDIWWEKSEFGNIYSSGHGIEYFMNNFKERVGEQIRTGGVTYCFSSRHFARFYFINEYKIDNYFFCPVDLGIVNEEGTTFYPKYEELRYFIPLFKNIPLKEVEWNCYFSKPPPEARILGVNRAGYAVFMEIPLGTGKLVMLPRFKDKQKAVTIIINEIVHQMIREEEFAPAPPWLYAFSSPYEQRIKSELKELEIAKRLLFTRDKVLKKTVAFAFEKLGFKVEPLPDGTLPDLRVSDGGQKASVEIKGHENRQADRKDIGQLLTYLSESDTEEKGIFVANHEFNLEPDERSKKAFTEGAIQVGSRNDISLISTIDLYGVVMKVIEVGMDEVALGKIRKKIMTGCGTLISLCE